MNVTIEKTELILKKIKELPPMPLVVQKLIQVMDDDRKNADDIMQVLMGDQALAGRILKLVNSSFYGLSGKVSTISRAVVILGHSAIRNLAMGLGVARLMAASDQDQLFWDHSIACASACAVIAKKIDYPDPEEAFIAGLLHDLGHIVLKSALPEEFAATMAQGPKNMVENEQKNMGMAHTKAGQKLLKHWKLPANLGHAVRFHHTAKIFTGKDDPLISLVALADALTCVHGEVYERSIGEEDFMALIKTVGIDVTRISELLTEIDQSIIETRKFLGIQRDTSSDIPGGKDSSLQVVMFCSHPMKATWTKEVMQFFGHRMVPMKEFFENVGEENDADLVILDSGSLSSAQLLKIKPALEKTTARITIFGRDKGSIIFRSLGVNHPIMPLAFSRSDLIKDPSRPGSSPT